MAWRAGYDELNEDLERQIRRGDTYVHNLAQWRAEQREARLHKARAFKRRKHPVSDVSIVDMVRVPCWRMCAVKASA